MSDIKTKLIWKGGLKFTGTNADGTETAIDGDRQSGASPLELLMEALGSCPATDVVSILEKMRERLSRLEISLEGDRHSPEPRYLTAVRVRFDLWGEGLNSEKVRRAINLSFVKYCSVYHSLRSDLKLQPQFRIHNSDAAASGDYQPVELTESEPPAVAGGS